MITLEFATVVSFEHTKMAVCRTARLQNPMSNFEDIARTNGYTIQCPAVPNRFNTSSKLRQCARN